MLKALTGLREKLALIDGLGHASTVMGWDQKTHMPPGGARSRARAHGAVSRVIHEMSTSAEFGRLLEAAEAEAVHLHPDSDEARLVWWVRREFDRAIKLPPAFMAELRQTTSLATQVWQEARRANDYARFAPHLASVIKLQRQLVGYLGYEDHPYDVLLDLFEPEMKTAEVRLIFDQLRGRIVPLVQKIAERAQSVDDSCLHQPFDEAKQWALAREVTELFGYDYQRGRMDPSAHPFCTTIAQDDVRVTVRVYPDFFNAGFFSAVHECGHALYNQGLPEKFAGTPLLHGASSAIHESQSRLWENIVGRSRGFWQHFYPRVQALFPEQLGGVELESFYRAINRSEPSLIRVEADEVTYNLHIMLRFDLELALMEEELQVEELPARWNEKMEEYLGIVPPTDADGIMQDTHWASGLFGYFPTYALGNVISVQLFESARQAIPELPKQIERGEMQPLLEWMRKNIHDQGRKFLPQELLLRATHQPLTAEPYLHYLEQKFGEIYSF